MMGDGDGHCYRKEALMPVVDVMAMVKDIVIGLMMYSCDKRDGDGGGCDGHCYRIDASMHVIELIVMVMEVMDIVIG